ncbi:unnamed protein product [Rhizoctonia solani]|uniref:Uncharacterized protein n=1 Tax=Rhizoctonia solani TaxID=456999 RepID=A0A8H2WW84_9AGAM|nr:unnamed protein product [Rhizoctonia solani]CAE6532326.1 unnamed protein product [Rhizoctonia solani]
MQVSQKQTTLFIRAIISTRATLIPRRLNSTQISSLLHGSLGVKLPPRKPIILPGNVGLTFNDRLAALRADIDSGDVAGIWKRFSDLRDAGQVDHISLSDLEEVDEAIAPAICRYGSTSKATSKTPNLNSSSPHASLLKSESAALGPIEQIHELGLWLAVRGPMCILRACMIHALRDSKPEIALGLWQSFMSRCLKGEGAHFLDAASRSEASSATNMPKPNDDPLGPEPSTTAQAIPQQNLLTYHPGRPELLQLTICAYAMQDDFRGAFDAVYPTLVPLKPEIARDLLEPIRQVREEVVFKAIRYINDLDLLRLLARPWSFRNHLFNFVHTLHVEKFQSIYQEILRLLREPDSWVGPLTTSSGPPPISPDPKGKPIFSVSRQTWTDLIEGAGALRRPDLRESIWKDFISLGGTPTTGMWNTLLIGYLREGSLENAEKVWLIMGKDGHDAYTYTTMMRGLFERGLPNKAIAYYEEMKKKIPQADIGIRSYNIVIHGLFTNGRAPAALQLVSELETGSALPAPTHPAPDITTYNTVLRHHGRRKEMAPLSKVLHTIADKQLRPDVYTLTTIMNALIAVGMQEAPSRILQVMKALRVQVNEAVASELIEDVVYRVPGRAAKKDELLESTRKGPRTSSNPSTDQEMGLSPRERLQTGVKMLVAFENAGVNTNVINYTSLMAAFHRAAGAGTGPQSISHEEAQRATQALRMRMQKRNIHENRVTYNILIAACLEGGDVPKLKWKELSTHTAASARPAIHPSSVPPNVEQAVRYFHEMRSAGVIPNHDTWYILLQGVASHGQIPLAQALCNELLKTKFVPQTGLLKLMMQIRGGN